MVLVGFLWTGPSAPKWVTTHRLGTAVLDKCLYNVGYNVFSCCQDLLKLVCIDAQLFKNKVNKILGNYFSSYPQKVVAE